MTARPDRSAVCYIPLCVRPAVVLEDLAGRPGDGAPRCRPHWGRVWSCPRCLPFRISDRRWCPTCKGLEWIRAAELVTELATAHGIGGRRHLLELLRAVADGGAVFYSEEEMRIGVFYGRQ